MPSSAGSLGEQTTTVESLVLAPRSTSRALERRVHSPSLISFGPKRIPTRGHQVDAAQVGQLGDAETTIHQLAKLPALVDEEGPSVQSGTAYLKASTGTTSIRSCPRPCPKAFPAPRTECP
jgi:hypothetical protein